ncbi:MAG TPA: hypothetical protein VHB01_05105 [Nitrosospira sp.]|nr:hypothetical protein [Nitrosospira sp.]
MRATIVILAIMGLSSFLLDKVHEAEPAENAVALSVLISEPAVSADEDVTLKTGESNGGGQSVAHLKDIPAVADLGSLLLIGVALAGLVAAPRRENRKARNTRRIT